MSSLVGHRLPIGHPKYQYPPSKNPYWTKLQELKGAVFSDNETETHSGRWRSQFADAGTDSRLSRLPADEAAEQRVDQSAHPVRCGLGGQEPEKTSLLRSVSKQDAERSEPTENEICGKYRQSTRKLHVEIGCNAGHVIVEWANRQPSDAYIGIDWKFKPIFRGVEKGQKKNLKNLIFFRAHAERLVYMFGPGEIDRLSLFFPDPWPRKSQWKNRFITAERLKEVSKLIKKDGVFHIKTDHRGYFDWMLEAVEQSKDTWKVLEMSMDLHRDHPSPQSLEIPDVTLFEKLFIKDKLPIHSLLLQPL